MAIVNLFIKGLCDEDNNKKISDKKKEEDKERRRGIKHKRFDFIYINTIAEQTITPKHQRD
jgi:hypothetical protein